MDDTTWQYSELVRELTLLLRRGRSIGGEFAEEIHPGLDLAIYSTLAQIAETEPARATDLVEHFRIDKAAVSRQLRDLERLGLIARTTSPSDRRAVAVRLTPEGRRRLEEATEARVVRFQRMIADWPQHDIDEFIRLLGRLNRLPPFFDSTTPPTPPSGSP